MQLHITFNLEPEPMPTTSPLPDIAQVSDFSSAISGILGAVLLVIAGLAWRKASSWLAEVTADVKATKTQTVNHHETNLRDDLTLAIRKIDDVATEVKSMGAQQGAMYEDLRDTRRDVRFNVEYTRDVDKRLLDHVDRTRYNKEEGH